MRSKSSEDWEDIGWKFEIAIIPFLYSNVRGKRAFHLQRWFIMKDLANFLLLNVPEATICRLYVMTCFPCILQDSKLVSIFSPDLYDQLKLQRKWEQINTNPQIIFDCFIISISDFLLWLWPFLDNSSCQLSTIVSYCCRAMSDGYDYTAAHVLGISPDDWPIELRVQWKHKCQINRSAVERALFLCPRLKAEWRHLATVKSWLAGFIHL